MSVESVVNIVLLVFVLFTRFIFLQVPMRTNALMFPVVKETSVGLA